MSTQTRYGASVTPEYEFFQKQLVEWDQAIRNGQSSQVKKRCRLLNHKSVPRELLIDYAQIARRVGAPELIVRWLRPLVHNDKALDLKPSEKEKALYALGLLRLGAFREAGQMLSKIDAAQDPEVYFYRASFHMNQWYYSKAVPELKKYVRNKNVPLYSRMVGRLNLCASLIACDRLREAETEIARLEKKFKKSSFSLLMGNLLEIRSQLYCEIDRIDLALVDLQQAAVILQKADDRSRLNVDKWIAVMKMKSPASRDEVLADFMNVKARAVELSVWEIARDCDFYISRMTKDESLFLKVYWGSLFPHYKKRILKSFGTAKLNEHFLWPPVANESATLKIDLVQLAPTKLLKQVFFIMTRELYRPLQVTEIISSLYPDEYYNPKTSPEKLHQILTRARDWLRSANLPIEIKAHQNSYKLELASSCQLILRKEFLVDSMVSPPPAFENETIFTTEQWAKEKSVSLRTARRQIAHLKKAGFIKPRGLGRYQKAS